MAIEASLTIAVNRIHYPVTSLGPGRRIGVWVQGCTIGCVGCVSTDTWKADQSFTTTTTQILERCKALASGTVEGITISGGEPFQQPEALAALVAAMRRQWPAADVLVYSGLPLEVLRRDHESVLAGCDAVISDPFDIRRAPGEAWCGSSNQRLTLLTDLGRRRYRAASESTRRLQVSVEADGVWFIGVPLPGDLQRVVAAAARRGVRLGGASWRA